jgi:hypothetical protein
MPLLSGSGVPKGANQTIAQKITRNNHKRKYWPGETAGPLANRTGKTDRLRDVLQTPRLQDCGPPAPGTPGVSCIQGLIVLLSR